MDLRRHALKSLPHYMTPNKFVQLEELPLTPNGKIDSKALAEIKTFERHGAEEFVPPEGEFECLLASIWCGVLRVDKVGRFDNFFELGGNSMAALQVITIYARKTRRLIKPYYLLMRSLNNVVKMAHECTETVEHVTK